MRRIALSKSEIQNCKIVYIEKENKAKYNMVHITYISYIICYQP